VRESRALKILFDTYWSPKGWKSAGVPGWRPQTPPADYEFALQAGVMFPPQDITHEQALQRIGELRSRLSPQRVGTAFLRSLVSGEVGLRSALGSYAVALHMPLHRFKPYSPAPRCRTCGGYEREYVDVNVLNFERHKWGGVRHSQPAYIAFDLERFTVEEGRRDVPQVREVLSSLLAIIDSTSVGAKLSDLTRSLKGVVPGNEAQRRTVISILGYAGILSIPGRSGFLESFIPTDAREETPWYKDDWPYPVRWWKGGAGANARAVEFWFGST
jgi:hypothetical protein